MINSNIQAKKLIILLLGSGGREHALAWKISTSLSVEKLYIAPGNAGMEECGDIVTLNNYSTQTIIDFCHAHNVSLCIIGPENFLAEGLANALSKENIPVFGPEKKGAELEFSKAFTKDLCHKENIPTANFKIFVKREEALSYLHNISFPCVIKADGLAAGKGVVIANNLEDSQAAIHDCFDGKFSDAGKKVIIEEFLEGTEVSFFVLSDGETILPFGSAQDYKRAYDGDMGPNTGGMGAISPSPHWNESLEKECLDTIVKPTINALKKHNISYKGVLYAGIMLTTKGPKLIEFNVRFGDPECQLLMLRYAGDVVETLYACAVGKLHEITPKWHCDHAVNIVLASKGYPKNPIKGEIIHIPKTSFSPDTHEIIFHAGTIFNNHNFVANGGRVLNCCARGQTLQKARDSAYKLMHEVKLNHSFFRKDIGKII